jgi:hypothetical protein
MYKRDLMFSEGRGASVREREIFLAACDIDNLEKRFEYLRQACGGDFVLRKRVEDLLAIDREEHHLLNQSPWAAATSHLAAHAEECEGTILGRYRLLEKIGEGGFALVYMAEQTEPMRRRVAAKVIKAGMDTRQVIARFEAERQALGLMDHPNIAKVYDGGTTPSGRPYFVMELVRGSPITEFCDAQRLTTLERMVSFYKSVGRCSTHTKKALFIAISSLRTFWWQFTTMLRCQRSSISASPKQSSSH